MVCVFNLSFSQRRFIVDAPIDGAQPFVNKSAFKKFEEGGGDHRFVLRRHGEIRFFKLSQYAETLELLPLQLNVLIGVCPAGLPHLERRHL